MTIRHLSSLHNLPLQEVEALLELAEALRSERAGSQLKGRAVVSLFLAPSLRTRVSMELAAAQLGAHCVTLNADQGLWGFAIAEGKVMDGAAAEHLKEAIGVLGRYGDLLAIRAFPSRNSWAEDSLDPILSAAMRYSSVPVLNLESCRYHPCQALADLLTLRRLGAKKGEKFVLSWAPHPKALPIAVPSSTALAAAQMGYALTIAHPEGYDLPADVLLACEALAEQQGQKVTVTHEQLPALDGAHYVYAKSWGRTDRYGDTERELQERKDLNLATWRIDESKMARGHNARFMHCLPVRRNIVVTDEVLDSPRSIVLDQAENRLHAQKAILHSLLMKD